MLTELYIRDFAIIDELRIHFDTRFNVLTGETGAGKSIILDAMALVLGERADTTMVRAGCKEAYVEATFTMAPSVQVSLALLLEEEGLDGDDPSVVMLARELRLNGRNICRINGRSVNLTLLRQIGDYLVDIHGQGEHLSLLKPRSHLPLLDSYAGLNGERTAVRQAVGRLRKVRRELDELRQNERNIAQRVDLLSFQVQEIEAAGLKPGEDEALKVERNRLANVERLIQHSSASLNLLLGVDDDTPAIVDMLNEVERAMTHLARLDPEQGSLLERLQGLSFQIGDLATELRDYENQLEFNPDRLGHVEERLELINQLRRKYGDDIPAILAYRDRAAGELTQISHSEERIKELVVEEEKLLREVGRLAEDLSQKRREAASRLASGVVRELADLHMDRSRFEVDFQRTATADGAFVGEDRLAFDETGIDRVEFLISANPGEPPRPLVKVASGGETARLMLALKTVLAQVDATPTLIFDEIDQGIGGRVGDVVGQKLWGLTNPANHQVIVVTHLPQLAGYAEGHFHVSKRLVGERTTTAVSLLNGDARVRELAAMLGTQGEFATGGAESILKQVAAVKAKQGGVVSNQ